MGFWHTGYIDHYEIAGLGDSYMPPPRVFRCDVCKEVHTTFEALRWHRLEAHPFKRPVLYVGGREVPDIGLRLTSPLTRGSVTALTNPVGSGDAQRLELETNPFTNKDEGLFIKILQRSFARFIGQASGLRV